MATVTISVVSNADGSMTATSSATAPAQTVTSLSLTEIQTVIRGWIQQGLWRYRTQLMDEPLGDVLARALDRQEQVAREAAIPAPAPRPTTQVTRATPPTPPSLHELAKKDDATDFIRAFKSKYKNPEPLWPT